MPVNNKFLRPILEGQKRRVEFSAMSDQDIVDLGDTIKESVGEEQANAFWSAAKAAKVGKVKGLDLDFSAMTRQAPRAAYGGAEGMTEPGLLFRFLAGETAATKQFPGLEGAHEALGQAQETVGKVANRIAGVPEPLGPFGKRLTSPIGLPSGTQGAPLRAAVPTGALPEEPALPNLRRILSMVGQAPAQFALSLAKDATT